MKKITFFILFFLLIPIALADDEYKPYLHKPVIPDHPEVKLYGSYSTNLFPGAATYSYNIEVPKGTNSLQPSLTVSYNSQSVKQRPSILGAGWSITQSYIYRDVNSTVSNSTDDEFKLILNGVAYDLIYYDSYYHTKTETFAKIENLTEGFTQYFLVTLKDGTKLRFGYNENSLLTSNTGYNYDMKWYLDQIQDLHGNKIYYTYVQDPYSEDVGTVYLSSITYNNDQKRKISFDYEDSARPDLRLAFEQGNKLQESRRLENINIYFNGSLLMVRKVLYS